MNFIGFTKSPLYKEGQQVAQDTRNKYSNPQAVLDKGQQIYNEGKNVVSAFVDKKVNTTTNVAPNVQGGQSTPTAGNNTAGNNNKMLMIAAGVLVGGALLYSFTKKSKSKK